MAVQLVEKNSSLTNSLTDFSEKLKRYKQSFASEREALMRALQKSEKLVTHLAGTVVLVSASVGKMLHCLLTNSVFDMKEFSSVLDYRDMPLVQEMVAFLENSDCAKKQKLFKGLNDRLNFASKVDLPLMQDAFVKVQQSVQLSETMSEFDEFLALTGQQQPFANNSILSTNKSRISNQNESDMLEIQQDFELFERSNTPVDSGRPNGNGLGELSSELLARLRDARFEELGNDFVQKYLGTLGEVTSELTRDDEGQAGSGLRTARREAGGGGRAEGRPGQFEDSLFEFRQLRCQTSVRRRCADGPNEL